MNFLPRSSFSELKIYFNKEPNIVYISGGLFKNSFTAAINNFMNTNFIKKKFIKKIFLWKKIIKKLQIV